MKTIIDVLNEYYYNSGQREQSYKKNPVNLVPKKLFKPSNIKSDLDSVQKIIVYTFLIRMSKVSDISHTDTTIF